MLERRLTAAKAEAQQLRAELAVAERRAQEVARQEAAARQDKD